MDYDPYAPLRDDNGDLREEIWIQKPVLNPLLSGRFRLETESDLDLLPWRPYSGEIIRMPDRLIRDRDGDEVLAYCSIALEEAMALQSIRFYAKDTAARDATLKPTHTPAIQLPLFIPPTVGTKVYFQTDGEAIKIGRTDITAESRRRAHQTGNPRTITTLIVIPGASERRLHARFEPYRLPGRKEWFRMAPELMAFITAWQLVEGAFD